MVNKQLLDMSFLHDYKLENTSVCSNIVFSLTSIPSRFIHPQFDITLESLYNQTMKPKYIIINLCHEYNRTFSYDKNQFESKIQYYKEKYDNIIINFSKDFGPITKILGLHNLKDLLNHDDIVIVVDDDNVYEDKIIYFYNLCYQLYTCDCIFIEEKNILNKNNSFNTTTPFNIFYDNYKDFVNGWLSFSMKFNVINKLYEFYHRIIKDDQRIINHDDLIITLFYKIHNLYACGMNLITVKEFTCQTIHNLDALSIMEMEHPFRLELEKTFFKKYNINYRNRKLSKHSINTNLNETILPRTLLFNISNVSYYPEKNNFHFKHIDLKYFDKFTFILTVTYFNHDLYFYENNEQKKIYLHVDEEVVEISLITVSKSFKQSYFVKLDRELKKIEHKTYDFNIIQTSSTKDNLHINKFYSINTILSYIPDIKYEFFDNFRQLEYLQNKNRKLKQFLLKLIPGAYKADLFRAVYLYYEGGLYFDCKNVLYTPFHFFISKEKSLCQDLTKGLYNGNLFFSKSYNECLKLFLLKILDNIKYDSYNKNHLSVTGGHLFSNYIYEDSDEDVCLKNKYENDEWINNPTEFNKTDKWQYSFVVEIKTGKIILKTSYYKYYNDETTRIDYVDLYKKKEIYLPIVITDEIDNILDI
jgi:hypothetical protein